MTVTQGPQHEFLGMHINFLGDGTVTIHMPSYIQRDIDESGLHISRSMPTPCASSLLAIDAASPLLPPTRTRSFHSSIAKLIYVGTCARTDILLALGFLCSRISAPTEQDEKKLQCLLEYLHGTIHLQLRLGADSLSSFSTWVDASFAVHSDMRSHTGGGGLFLSAEVASFVNLKNSPSIPKVSPKPNLLVQATTSPIHFTIFFHHRPCPPTISISSTVPLPTCLLISSRSPSKVPSSVVSDPSSLARPMSILFMLPPLRQGSRSVLNLGTSRLTSLTRQALITHRLRMDRCRTAPIQLILFQRIPRNNQSYRSLFCPIDRL
jgi:hypothetical protein